MYLTDVLNRIISIMCNNRCECVINERLTFGRKCDINVILIDTSVYRNIHDLGKLCSPSVEIRFRSISDSNCIMK